MVRYPIVLERDGDTILVTFPDFPEAHTFGRDREEALTRAPDALATIIDAYIRDRQLLPAPSAIVRHAAALPALLGAKAELYNAMQHAGVTKSELARRLNWHLPQVDRLLDLRHASRLDQLEAAARALGGHLELQVRMDAPAPQRYRVKPRAGWHRARPRMLEPAPSARSQRQ
jgi:antitoxin HicB